MGTVGPTAVIRARHAWIGGRFQAADVRIEGGRIADLSPPRRSARGVTVIAEDAVLLPGLVDTHVHVNEPGRTGWEGFRSGTLAAAAGGITTLIDMPLNSIPPTTTIDALDIKRLAASRRSYVDVGFWGGAVPENLGALRPLRDAGVFGFKCFLAPSGVDEFGHLDREQLHEAMAEVAAIDSRLIVHAEDPALLGAEGSLGRGYAAFLTSRPPASERSAIEAVITAARATGARAHILHLSDAGALPMISAAKAEGLRLTVETCPHYLTLVAEDIPEGATEFKCCPPIRGAANRDGLWRGIRAGLIDAIVSDHSPSPAELKRAHEGDFGLAWGGISGLQLALPAVWSEARRRGVPLGTLLPLFTTGPGAVAGMSGAGRIEIGAPAHLTAFGYADPFTVDAERLQHRHPISAYHGRRLTGRIRRTWVHGHSVFDVTEGGAGAAPGLRRDPVGRLLTASGVIATRHPEMKEHA